MRTFEPARASTKTINKERKKKQQQQKKRFAVFVLFKATCHL